MDTSDIISIISLAVSSLISIVSLVVSCCAAKKNCKLQEEFKKSDDQLKKELQAADHAQEEKILLLNWEKKTESRVCFLPSVSLFSPNRCRRRSASAKDKPSAVVCCASSAWSTDKL